MDSPLKQSCKIFCNFRITLSEQFEGNAESRNILLKNYFAPLEWFAPTRLVKEFSSGKESIRHSHSSRTSKSHFVTVCHILSHFVSHFVTFCHILSHFVTFCHILSQFVSHFVTFCHILSHFVTVCVTFCHILSQFVTVCHSLSQFVTVCHSLSHFVTFSPKFFFLLYTCGG